MLQKTLDDADGFSGSKLRVSALTAASPTCGSPASKLRRSALPAASPQAEHIITMENADVESLLLALTTVVMGYAADASQKEQVRLFASVARVSLAHITAPI